LTKDRPSGRKKKKKKRKRKMDSLAKRNFRDEMTGFGDEFARLHVTVVGTVCLGLLNPLDENSHCQISKLTESIPLLDDNDMDRSAYLALFESRVSPRLALDEGKKEFWLEEIINFRKGWLIRAQVNLPENISFHANGAVRNFYVDDYCEDVLVYEDDIDVALDAIYFRATKIMREKVNEARRTQGTPQWSALARHQRQEPSLTTGKAETSAPPAETAEPDQIPPKATVETDKDAPVSVEVMPEAPQQEPSLMAVRAETSAPLAETAETDQTPPKATVENDKDAPVQDGPGLGRRLARGPATGAKLDDCQGGGLRVSGRDCRS
jgi:hypothetical protein